MSEQEQNQSEKARGRRQVKTGTVISAKMDKTVVVQVEKIVMHSLYKRRLRRSSKFRAHDASNECREGDVVTLESTRPISKSKRWKVRDIVKRAQA